MYWCLENGGKTHEMDLRKTGISNHRAESGKWLPFNQWSWRFLFPDGSSSASRNDHALLMACTKAPNHRCNMVHRLSERLIFGDRAKRGAGKKTFSGCPPRNLQTVIRRMGLNSCPHLFWKIARCGTFR